MIVELLAEPVHDRELSFRARHQTMILLASFTIFGLILRIGLAARSGIWCDEAQFLWVIRMPTLQGMIDFLWYHESHPPLFYILMRGWLGIFGDSEPAALSLPILFGTALIPATYYVANRIFSSRTGLIAAAMSAASPVLANYSGHARPYSFLAILCLTSVYLLWRGLCGGGARIWAAQAAIGLAMLLTHNWGWVVLCAETTVVAIYFLAGRLSTTVLAHWAIAQVVVIVGYAPWAPALLYQVRHSGSGPRAVDLLEATSVFAEMMTSLPSVVVLGLMLLLIVVALGQLRHRSALVTTARFLDKWGIALLLFAGIPLIAFAVAVILSRQNNLVHALSLITLTPCGIITIALAIASAPTWPRLFGGLLVFVYLLSSLQLLSWDKANTSAVAEAVAARVEPSDIVVVTPCWRASSFDYYFKPKNRQIVYPYNLAAGRILYDRIRNRLLDPEPISKFRVEIDQAYQEARRIWLVKSDDIPGSPWIAPETDTFPPELQTLTHSELGTSRANQITEMIESKFGKPTEEICPHGDRPSNEIVRAYLYTRGQIR